MSADTYAIVRQLLELKPTLSYFALHKLFYLCEVQSLKTLGRRLTNAYIVRQKDGPYCTDLHLAKLKRAIPGLQVSKSGASLALSRGGTSLFDAIDLRVQTSSGGLALSSDAGSVVNAVIVKYGQSTDARLKTAVYLTSPMKFLLALEKDRGVNTYNTPINFDLVRSRHRLPEGAP